MLSPFSSLPRPNVDISRGLLLRTIEDEALDEESGTGGCVTRCAGLSLGHGDSAQPRAETVLCFQLPRDHLMLKRTSTVIFTLTGRPCFSPGSNRHR